MTRSQHDFTYMTCALTVPPQVPGGVLLLIHIFDSGCEIQPAQLQSLMNGLSWNKLQAG